MYAKMIIYDEKSHLFNGEGISDSDGNTGCKVVPYGIHMFEGLRMSYRKIRVKGYRDFNKISSALGSYSLISSLPSDHEKDGVEDEPFEFILLAVYSTEDGGPEYYISAVDSVMFVMNESGKTIDKLACRNNH